MGTENDVLKDWSSNKLWRLIKMDISILTRIDIFQENYQKVIQKLFIFDLNTFGMRNVHLCKYSSYHSSRKESTDCVGLCDENCLEMCDQD